MRKALIPLLLLAPATAAAQAAGQWQGPAQIFDVTCRYCHEAGIAPPLIGARPAPALVAAAVRRGPGGMPAFTPTQISDAELRRLADWLQRQPPPPRPRGGSR